MFHSAHIQVPNRQRRRTGLTTFFPSSSFSPPDSRETMRKGILFCSIAIILLLVGSVLTWLEYNNMFGGKISMTGPLLIALAFLMMLLSLRQFRLARKRSDMANRAPPSSMQLEAMNASGGMTTLVIDHEEGVGTTAVVLECEPGDPQMESHHRFHGEIGPPSYGDATYLDCSSTCPSFISHDDHNEAPPTYEETCGIFIYGSETSLGTLSSRRQSKGEASSPRLFSSNVNTNLAINQNSQRSNTLSPSSALFINTGTRAAISNNRNEMEEGPSRIEASCCSSVSISSDETVTVIDCIPTSNSDQRRQQLHHSHQAQPGDIKNLSQPRDWSRRSYSSIPSYTCLLSESGEVSSQVFSPSSIISQMDNNSHDEPDQPETSASSTSAVPTRSQSASSINKLRQGVPYNLTVTTSHEKFSSSSHSVDSPTRRRSEGSRPNIGGNPEGTPKSVAHPRSDSSICNVVGPLSVTTPGPESHDNGDSPQRHQGNYQSDIHSIPSFSQQQHSSDLLTQDIQETI